MTGGAWHLPTATVDTRGNRTTSRITLPDSSSTSRSQLTCSAAEFDQADFTAYIFPLMFFERISDVFDEDFEHALEESGGDQE